MKRHIAWPPGRRFVRAVGIAVALAVGCEGKLHDSRPDPTGQSNPDAAVSSPPPTVPNDAPFAPAPALLHRLTQDEYLAALAGLMPEETPAPTDLPPDTKLHGYASVGGSELAIPPRDVEQYEAAAQRSIDFVLADPARRLAFFGCDIESGGEPCLRTFLIDFGLHAWRRPLTDDELDNLVELANDVGTMLRDSYRGAGFAVSAVLQSPHFLYRVERGEADPSDDSRLRYTSWEMASRLSFFLWGSPPDDELLRAAGDGELVTDQGIRAQVQRLFQDPRTAQNLSRFWAEMLSLDRLESVSKDPDLYPQWTPALRTEARTELTRIFADVVERDADYREVFTTNLTFVGPELAALYGLPPVNEISRAQVPSGQGRGGMLGRAGLLAIWSHATLNSPTLRGKFIRTTLLCSDVPPPPAGVITELPEATMPETLRQRLDRHRLEPACGACHALIDPLGFTLERFGPIGERRMLDNGLPIDDRGEVDGVELSGADGLGRALAANDRVGPCFARQFYRWAGAHLELTSELPEIEAIGRAFVANGHRIRALVEQIALSRAFRTAAYSAGDCTDGETRDCSGACGTGTESCVDGSWRACTAPPPRNETCNGHDDDCDGSIDENLTRACESVCGSGVERCSAGTFGACDARSPAAELCSHIDDDCDGKVDEGFAPMTVGTTYTAVREYGPICDGSTQRLGVDCNAAIDRFCAEASQSCGTSGFGPTENSGDNLQVACVHATRRETTWTALRALSPDCAESNPIGAACASAIHRLCAEAGLTTGYGPISQTANRIIIACVGDAAVIDTTYPTLTERHSGCTAARPMGPDCNAAIGRYCASQGAASGFGPLEFSGDDVRIACVRRAP